MFTYLGAYLRAIRKLNLTNNKIYSKISPN